MNLDDRQRLEINELCGALIDGRATEAQRVRLGELLQASEAARRYYVRLMAQSASLHSYAAEMQADARVVQGPWWRGSTVRVALLAAAAVVLGAFIWMRLDRSGGGKSGLGPDYVARLTGAKNAEWMGGASLQPGVALRKGQRLELKAGYAEITFDSGAQVVLEGDAALEINSAWDANLQRGVLKADVPPEAIGFRITNRFVEVIDLGTEFTLIADSAGGAELLVNKGEVEAAPRTGGNSETILLREKESRRFAASGVTEVEDSAQKFARFDEALVLERFASGARYAHWSFDEARGAVQGEGPLARAGAQGRLFDDQGDSRSAGRYERALRFDGHRYASVPLADISDDTPRTVAFWVRVPTDAQPVDTWMVAWGTQLPKLGKRPVHIGWNRRPSEGALGALRTDFGGGHAIGTTNLRDGQWHHVAVYFAPGEDPDAPVQVKQYVDGRLESSTIVRGVLSARAGTGDATIADTLWLGYRLTGSRQEGRRFRGDIDELFVIGRTLQPREIVSLMRHNRLPDDTLASVP